MRIDEEFKGIIPPLAPDELDQLEASIQTEGCRDALVVWQEQDILLDGHHRREICERLKIEYKTISLSLRDRNTAMLWIIDNQKGRRNLSDIDRIALQLKRKDIVARIAAEKRKETQGRPVKDGKKLSADLRSVSKVKTSKELARAAGVGERTFDAGVVVLQSASPADIEAIRRKEKSIHAVAKVIKESNQRGKRRTKRLAAAEAALPWDDRVVVGDFRKHADKVADGSLSLIFTDPPYNREASKMLPDLAAFAKAKLAEGGSLLCYVGQTQLPTALDAFRKELRYWWVIACLHAGRATVMREYGVDAHWKAVLWFVKGTRDDNSIMVNDVMSGGQEKTHHDWQQAESEASYWIEKLCPVDGLVCDPFLGGGTTAAAAEKLKRKWIAFEIDADTARIAAERVNK